MATCLEFSRVLFRSPSWVCLDNYVRLLEDNRFHQALRVTFEYVIISVPLQLIIALLVAMALDSGLRGMGLYRSAFYLPSLIGGSVAIAILWRQVFGANGLVKDRHSVVRVILQRKLVGD